MLTATRPPAAPAAAPTDLVPSRYAVKIGEIEALVVSDGVLPLPTSTMATNAGPITVMPQVIQAWCRTPASNVRATQATQRSTVV